MRTKKSELQNLLSTISELSGISTEKKEGEKYHLHLKVHHIALYSLIDGLFIMLWTLLGTNIFRNLLDGL